MFYLSFKIIFNIFKNIILFFKIAISIFYCYFIAIIIRYLIKFNYLLFD